VGFRLVYLYLVFVELVASSKILVSTGGVFLRVMLRGESLLLFVARRWEITKVMTD